jgi:pimeloyl-ACP methyl ester carboxylesterase
MKERIIEVRGQKLYTACINSFEGKPVIVFLHDSLGCTQLWRDFPVKLSEATGCNVLMYDRLGYGKSDPMTTHERPVNYMELEADLLNDLLTELTSVMQSYSGTVTVEPLP